MHLRKLLIFLTLLFLSIPAFASTYQSTIIGDGPVCYYQMGESSGTTATDSSGNGYTGTYSASNISYNITGPILNTATNAITIASGGYMDSEQQSTINPGSGNFTIEIWIKTTQTALQVAVGAANSSLTGDNYWIGANDTTGKATFSAANTNNSGGVTATSAATVNDGNWHLIDGVLNGTTLTVYVDGSASGTPGTWVTGASFSIPGQLVVGQFGNYNGSLNWVGSVAQMAYYPSALTGTQISNHYNARQFIAPVPNFTVKGNLTIKGKITVNPS